MTVTLEPVAITAGDTITWQRSVPDYPAGAGWVLAYTLINGTHKISFSSTAAGDDHLVLVSAATTAAWTAGHYSWQATVTKAAERHTISTGTMRVLPNLAAATTLDNRTPARKALDDVDAALRLYGAKAYTQSFSIGDRQQQFRTPEEFLAYRSRLMAEVAREDRAATMRAGLAGRNAVYVRFGAGR